MIECDYCGTEVDEADYLDHLRADHREELGTIDRRRVEQATAGREANDRLLGGRAFYLLPAVGIAIAVVAFVYLSGGGGGEGSATGLPERGDEALLTDVERVPSEGTEHVTRGTRIDYERVPPLSGPHYGTSAEAGFYEETPALGAIVHSLEHGAVVIYYDPAALDGEAESSLRAYATEHTGAWKSVIVAPNPNEEPATGYVLTAWRHRLRLDGYDEATVRAFLAEYLGRGPENAVR
jgi:hypothetical protein